MRTTAYCIAQKHHSIMGGLKMKSLPTLISATCILAGLATTAIAQNATDEIAAVKAATEKYRDVNVALAEGFVPDPSGHCITIA